ncbi:class I SAM-dependent methyltransferase [Alkalibacterium olivapovliticus]|uniref:Methyltransferase family protein n=1 Tax=Alkalibacterium olivapovliticus TaxID=99907 RepID=A0A2T0W6W1_9LACT|nr:methyltransferase domain-containing protein [Alkalibacterium olivapovliticus]PRY82435.1 methyltransferase family protein [Alkalibacterium olivapovliticus]
MTKNTSEKIRHRYNRISPVYESMDKMMKDKWRRELLESVHGQVLEVGIGTGVNLAFYPEGIHLTGIDFSPGMLNKARKKVEALQFPYQVDLIEMDIQEMDFPDNSFDYVIATCVFCSVPHPIKGLRELGRVCKSDGKIMMLEHMRSGNKVAGKLMDIVNPLPVTLWGANINRKTLENINEAGLTVEQSDDLVYTIVKKLKVTPWKE